jgi:hypothetical protein
MKDIRNRISTITALLGRDDILEITDEMADGIWDIVFDDVSSEVMDKLWEDIPASCK